MAEIHRLPDIKEIEREASDWLTRLDADDASAEDRAAFEAWLRAHPLHARTYAEMLETWQAFRATPLTGIAIEGVVEERRRSRYAPQGWRQWAMAVSGLLIAVLLGFHLHSLAAKTTFQTALGERVTISLPDGSKLQLNSDSRVRVDYSLRSRVISLERGEAFFEVAHNTARPFWVTTDRRWVRAVGTAFNVYLNPKGMQVTVREGTVKVGSGEGLLQARLDEDTLKKASAVLNAGEQAELRGNVTRTRKLSAEELARTTAWQSGWLYVTKNNLCEVIAEMNRYTPRRLILEDTQLCSLAVGGAFQANPQGAEALLELLEKKFGAQVLRESDRVYIRGATSTSVRM
ncbi:MAG: FecR domain-containing protein [Pseudomonadota bacterium]|nr:FecR domain-containing protein [Pseudomonadota bacterium]